MSASVQFTASSDPTMLDPAIWPAGMRREGNGIVTLAGHSVQELAETFGTPAFLIDETDVRARASRWRTAFGSGNVYYAGKAFLCTSMARWMAEEGLGLDVCSGGELAVALRAGFPAARLGFHGNNKSPQELAQAVDVGVGRIVVDSPEEVERLARIARARGRRATVLIRVTPGVEAHTHEFISTAHEDQKFGFSLADGAASLAVRQVLKHESLRLVGLHAHIGSQIFDPAGFELAAQRLVSLLSEIKNEHGRELPELDLGGGLGIAYTRGEQPLDVLEFAARIRDTVTRTCADSRIAVPAVSVEPGRAIIGPPGITLYRVGTVKPVSTGIDGVGVRTYVSVDGGMSDNIRPALYGAEYTCALVSRASAAPPIRSRVVGKHCESGDIVIRDAWLPADLAPGDLIAVAATGAYCRSMASNYNLLPRPPVIALRPDASYPVIRRETEQDLLLLDVH